MFLIDTGIPFQKIVENLIVPTLSYIYIVLVFENLIPVVPGHSTGYCVP
jgi:hypothetical protein